MEKRFERVSGRTRIVVFFDPDARMSNREDAARGFHRCNIFKMDDVFDPNERFDGLVVSLPPQLVEKHGIESNEAFEYVARCSLLYSLSDHPELVVERNEAGDLIFREIEQQQASVKNKRRPRSLQRVAGA